MGWLMPFEGVTCTYYIAWQAPEGMCGPCAGEHTLRASTIAKMICRQDYAGWLIASDHAFKVPAVQVQRRKQHEEIRWQHQVAQQYAEEVSVRVAALMVIDGNCGLGQLRASGSAGNLGLLFRLILAHVHQVAPAARW
jgi:hypothetical protein